MGSKVIRDPLHNVITLYSPDECLKVHHLMDTREFQRLRRIRQLGVGWFTYPGAEHSRFIHSLGVYHLAHRVIRALLPHGDTKLQNSLSEKIPIICAAALLHDVGHGPFSHVFENVFGSVSHEAWTVRILESEETEIHQALRYQGIPVDDVVSIIKSTHPDRYAVDIVSSQLDADRMDYLLRDALMTGVKYGSYDLDWLINSMRLAPVRLGASDRDGHLRLCVDGSKGLHAIEQYILARLYMYMQVYMHRTTRATEALFNNIIRLAAELAINDSLEVDTPSPILDLLVSRGEVDLETYLNLDDFLVLNTLTEWSSARTSSNQELATLARMCDTLINRRLPYRCIQLERRAEEIEAEKLVQHLETKQNDLRFHCYVDSWEQVPYKDVLYNLGEQELEDTINLTLFVIDSDGHGRPIESRSKVLQNLGRSEMRVSRFFYDAHYEDEFEQLFKRFPVRRHREE